MPKARTIWHHRTSRDLRSQILLAFGIVERDKLHDVTRRTPSVFVHKTLSVDDV